MDGKNIADFVDPDIEEKLAALEAEEERLLRLEAEEMDEDIDLAPVSPPLECAFLCTSACTSTNPSVLVRVAAN
jgi:hypothetical protein